MSQPFDLTSQDPVGSNLPTVAQAVEPASELPEEPVARYGLFLRDSHWFAVPIGCVVEVLPGQPLTRVPKAEPEIAGLVNLRGEILTVLLADSSLNIPSQPADPAKPILVLRQDENLFGIEVDRMAGVQEIPLSQIQSEIPEGWIPPQAGWAGWWHPTGQPRCTILTEDAFRDLVCPLDVSGDP